ncbi:MAG TPA: CoA pyrophosphatase [Spirochaetota bacterium]|nr:CoA pyrophosphatase [Spirochaetota bacterium]HPF06802.1 CoA pyrophosphatase [Spirochaetota bacterium]HPJ43142.1 CoA pyrophosphatase [Spirochaetota bacterium]HPR36403.1 CoA pyrophosphatase [Spirochaetota bacterium]HRX48003.1 CoA pyrophosphatase [Spirochaetota bacterium]
MKIEFSNNYAFHDFKQALRETLSSREKRTISFPDYRKSAVMMIFMERDNSPHVLLSLRTDRVSTHKGQVSFPGGSWDETDKDYLETALRETYEEVGIDPAEIEVLGEYDEYISIMGFHVYVYIGALNREIEYTPCADEIEEILEVPFSLFYNEQYDKCEKVTYDGRDYDVYYYTYGNSTIWGMTARILTDFSRKVCKE